MNKRLKIYEAGAMANLSFEEMNRWREKLKRLLEHYSTYYSVNLTVINPVDYFNFKDKRYQTEKEVMQYDLNHVKSSDIVIVNLNKLNTSIGSCIELYVAYKRGIPVIALGTKDMYKCLHPWIKEYITRVEETDEQIAEYIRDFYFIGWLEVIKQFGYYNKPFIS